MDEQVNTIDYPISGFLSVYNQSATYLVDGGSVALSAFLYQLAWLEMSGGSIGSDLRAYTSSELYLFGGSVGGSLRAYTVADVDWSGGSVGGSVVAYDDATIRIYGSGFLLDGAPVPYGVLPAATGILQGTLNDGTFVTVGFFHAGASFGGSTADGRIELVSGEPVQSPPPDFSALVALLNDGGTYDVDDDRYDDRSLGVRVRSPGPPTTLNVLPGAAMGYFLVTSEDSVLDVSGGDIGLLESPSTSVLNVGGQTAFTMTGGTVHGRSYLSQQATAAVSGGTLDGPVDLHGEVDLLFSGGTITGQLTNFEDTRIEITGGEVWGGLRVAGEGHVRGGDLGGGVIVEFRGDLEIVGTGFEVDGVPVPLGDVVAESGVLTGLLESGEPIDVSFVRNELVVAEETLQGRIVLLPEPGGLALLCGVALLWLLPRRGSRARG